MNPVNPITVTAIFALLHVANIGVIRADEEFFETQIRPIFAEHCYACHSQDQAASGLRLDIAKGFRTDNGNEHVIVPGKASASRLIQAVQRHATAFPMPPDRKLDETQIRLLVDWVDRGAKLPEDRIESSAEPFEHWSFQPMVRRSAPLNDDESWNDCFIDRWVYSGLNQHGLKPSEPANDLTLARRFAYDLTGLPPTQDFMERMQSDRDNPETVSSLIDELLNSPAFGERWGRHWLDVVRYSDTVGATSETDDLNPFAYSYRDWAIRTFNDDMPFNTFIENQIAADKLHPENDPNMAAVGFLTVGKKFDGNTPDVIDDQLDTIFRGLQGLTISCARCHDHKYDPISTADYYSLYSILSESTEKTVPIFRSEEDPVRYVEYKRKLREHKTQFADFLNEQRELRHKKPYLSVASYLIAASAKENDPAIVIDSSGRRSDGLHQEIVGRYKELLLAAQQEHNRIFAAWVAYASDETRDNFVKQAKRQLQIADRENARQQSGDDEIVSEPEQGASQEPSDESNDQEINPLIAEFIRGAEPSDRRELAAKYDELFRSIAEEWLALIQSARERDIDPPESLEDGARDEIRKLMLGEFPTLDLDDAGLRDTLEEKLQERFDELKRAISEYQTSDEAIEQATIFVDGGPREQRVFIRGKQDRPGKAVSPRFLSVLDPDHQEYGYESARQELARSIVDPHNPLTARVWVNRVWAHLFGSGLVKTPSDFGSRGERPTHPELLDALALDFIRNGWSTKQLIKKIVLSSAYQQATEDSIENAAIDPANRMLWRMNRKRLTSEAIRDAILVSCDSLDDSMFGRPIGLDNEAANSRRSIYLMVNRRQWNDISLAFDFANPAMHSPMRYESIAPQQALWLMNSEFVIEHVRSFDNEETQALSTYDVIVFVFRKILGRDPTEEEIELLSPTMEEWRQAGTNDADAEEGEVAEKNGDAEEDRDGDQAESNNWDHDKGDTEDAESEMEENAGDSDTHMEPNENEGREGSEPEQEEPAVPLGPIAKLAQLLLLSNEFIYID
jgi:mono/diheme cytochrome c family protein